MVVCCVEKRKIMESKKQGCPPSSLTDLFGAKELPPSASTETFASIFPPPSTVLSYSFEFHIFVRLFLVELVRIWNFFSFFLPLLCLCLFPYILLVVQTSLIWTPAYCSCASFPHSLVITLKPTLFSNFTR